MHVLNYSLETTAVFTAKLSNHILGISSILVSREFLLLLLFFGGG